MAKSQEKLTDLPLFKPRQVTLDYDSYPTFDTIIKFLVSMQKDKAGLAAAMDISPSNLSQRLNYESTITYSTRHVDAILHRDLSAYDILIEWLQHYRQKRERPLIERKAELFDRLEPLIKEILELKGK